MKLGDFFVGSRQLFGFLAPGVIWLFALYIPITSRPLGDVIRDAAPAEAFLFLALALLVGTAVESVSFGVAVRLSAAVRRGKVSREKHDFDYLPLSLPSDLIRRCRAVAARTEASPGYIDSLTDREFSQYCKYSVIDRSPKHGSRLLEYEAEINLLAMLVMPLALLAVSTAVWGLGGPGPAISPLDRVVVPGTALVITLLLLLRLHPLRREEAECWFRFFLMTGDGPESHSTATASRRVRAAGALPRTPPSS